MSSSPWERLWNGDEDLATSFHGAVLGFAPPCEGAQMQVACPSLNGQGDGWRERHTA